MFVGVQFQSLHGGKRFHAYCTVVQFFAVNVFNVTVQSVEFGEFLLANFTWKFTGNAVAVTMIPKTVFRCEFFRTNVT